MDDTRKMNWLNEQTSGVVYLSAPKTDFEHPYTTVRQKENRLLSDEAVQLLPNTKKDSPHASEWKKRADTLKRFQRYLVQKGTQTVLEIGCGNGWFAHQLASEGRTVIGLDVGQLELEQAARCFSLPHLYFVCCTDFSLIPPSSFDCIVFNASIQYFELSADWWQQLFALLKPDGEIHLLDSPFYTQHELSAAQQRSKTYFQGLDIPSASDYYFHQTWDLLPKNAKIHYKPNKWKRLLRPNSSPFPWICIQP